MQKNTGTNKKKDRIELSDHFTIGRLLRFTALPIIGVILASVYMVIDSWFVSEFISTSAFASVNLASPLLLVLPAVGFMVGGGGNALISKVLGEGDNERANQIFSMMVELALIAGFVMSIAGHFALDSFLRWQGAEGALFSQTKVYAGIMVFSMIFTVLCYVFQLFLVTADRELMAVLITLGSGVTNIALDALFILVFHWGLAGAAIASLIGQALAGIVPLVYFASGKNKTLKFSPVKLEFSVCAKACGNGLSEMIENLSEGFVGFLYNMQLVKLAGESGVSAYGAILNIWSILTLVFLGYDEAIVPVVAYHYGAKNEKELKNLFRLSLIIVGTASVAMFVLVELAAGGFAGLFIHDDPDLLKVTIHGFRICGFSLLFIGCNYFATSFFTALNNGFVSGLLSFLIMLVFPVLTVMTLPGMFEMEGVWISKVITAVAGSISSGIAFVSCRKKYKY